MNKVIAGTKKTCKLTTRQKSRILARLASGETAISLAAEYGVTRSNITHLRKRRGVEYATVERDIQQQETSIQQRLLAKTYTILENKLDTLKDKRELKKARVDHLSGVANDLWKQTQVQDGKPTDITTTKNSNELLVYIRDNYKHLSEVEPTQILAESYE